MNAPSSVPSRQPGDTRRWKPTPLIAGTAALHAARRRPSSRSRPRGRGRSGRGRVASRADRRRPVAAQHAARPELDAPAGNAGRRIALTIDGGPDPDVTRACSTCSTVTTRARRSSASAISRAVIPAGSRRSSRAVTRSRLTSGTGTFSLSGPRRAAARDRGRAADADRARRHAPAVLPCAGRPAQPVSRAGAVRSACSWRAGRGAASTRARDAATVTRRLLHGLAARDILLVHDGHAARDARGEPVVLGVLRGAARGRRCAIALTTLRAALAPQPPGEPGEPVIRHPV